MWETEKSKNKSILTWRVYQPGQRIKQKKETNKQEISFLWKTQIRLTSQTCKISSRNSNIEKTFNLMIFFIRFNYGSLLQEEQQQSAAGPGTGDARVNEWVVLNTTSTTVTFVVVMSKSVQRELDKQWPTQRGLASGQRTDSAALWNIQEWKILLAPGTYTHANTKQRMC